MSVIPTYAQIGVSAAWLVTVCRFVQGMSSIGEIVGAELYLTEILRPPTQYVAVAWVNSSALLGSLAALGVAIIHTSFGVNWRYTFLFGAVVSMVGAYAREVLRETPEFADAKKRIKRALEKAESNPEALKKNPFCQERVSTRTSLAYFLIQCGWPVIFYFLFFYCAGILKDNFGYTIEQVMRHNFIVAFLVLLRSIVVGYLSKRIHPLRIMNGTWIGFSVFAIGLPFLLSHVQSPLMLLVIQALLVLFIPSRSPGVPLFFKHFPIFRRFTYTTVLYSLSRALLYMVTSFGVVYLTEHLGYYGWWVLLVPVCLGYGFGVLHFIQLEEECSQQESHF